MGPRSWIILVAALAGCTSSTIDAGTNAGTSDGGTPAPAPVDGAADSGPTIVASLIQSTPTEMVSNGTSLFWMGYLGGISSMPVHGGRIDVIVAGAPAPDLLAADDVYVYYFNGGIYRASTDGTHPAMLVNFFPDGGGVFGGPMTVLGKNIYWIRESLDPPSGGANSKSVLKTAPLQGDAASTVAEFDMVGITDLGVTATTAFVWGTQLFSFSLASGLPDGGSPSPVPGVDTTDACTVVISDSDAIYCQRQSSSVLRVASDGTATVLGTFLPTALGVGQYGSLALDDRYVYWLDSVAAGRILRVPKTGGTPAVIAHDAYPVAVAVDANAVYWSDVGGNIMRLAK